MQEVVKYLCLLKKPSHFGMVTSNYHRSPRPKCNKDCWNFLKALGNVDANREKCNI